MDETSVKSSVVGTVCTVYAMRTSHQKNSKPYFATSTGVQFARIIVLFPFVVMILSFGNVYRHL